MALASPTCVFAVTHDANPTQVIAACLTTYFVSCTMLMRTLLSLVCLPVLALSLQAQTERYNPYAPVMEEPPIKDGKINWPTYYRSARMEQKYQGFFQTGSCVGTGKRVTGKLQNNQVDTNALPRTTIDSQVVTVQPGSLGTLAAQGARVELVIHPRGVSQIEVSGEMLAQQVAPGMIVRFEGSVDNSAHGVKPLEALQVISPSAELKPAAVTADTEQSILAKVIRHNRTQLVVDTGAGKMHQLTFLLPEQTPVSVEGRTLDLVAPGDTAHAEGLLYTGDNGERVVFAEKLVVRKAVRRDEHASAQSTSSR
jgi:hypothetical protein